jgi:hypothetical protein
MLNWQCLCWQLQGFYGLSQLFYSNFRILLFIFRYEYGLSDDFFLRWVYTPRDDGLPRVLSVQIPSDADNDSIPLLIERIKKV